MQGDKLDAGLRDVYIVDGSRTPFLKAKGKRGDFSASDLATRAGSSLLAKHGLTPSLLDEVIMGCVIPSEDEANIARIIALRMGCGNNVTGWTVQRNCASGMQSIDSAYKNIAIGRSDLIVAGGTEAMSLAPLIFQPSMVNWLGRFGQSKTFIKKCSAISQIRPGFFKPIISLMHGLTDYLTNHNMGQSTEELAYKFNITRKEMDEFALQSQQRACLAQDNKYFDDEITTIYDTKGNYYSSDTGVRRDTTIDALSKLRPTFDRKFGSITPANSSQVSDGSAMLLLASKQAVDKYKLPVLGRIVDTSWAGCDPVLMGLGPAYAVPPLLQKHNLTLQDINYWELNEAFAAQTLACLKAWESTDFCQTELGLDKALGSISQDKINVDGGAIALGHPVGASGARIVLHTLKVLERTDERLGVATLCIGGGLGGAMLLERV